ncbi:OmpW family protein [Sphingosinicella sp. BN140058]|uniref:OmpW/AlkL family protein n=1 Tax=Sphingosinicella sp. BN140058 TaxID=1892855 RepID=UPI0010139B80|nr:OmpW family outer membrane protein [Sphingosinicella sp. BN140058]QAY78502.1 OmpW family protein [Sphingosinicella sp. BN140058]
MKSVIIGFAAAAAFAQPAQAAEAGDVLVRVRAIMVSPTEKSGSILPGFPGETAKVDDSIMPEVDVTWMATRNVGFELIAATTKHTASGRTGTTGSIGKLASTWVLPPTLTAQYHFGPDAKVRPYVGAGLNYTLFYAENASRGLEAAVGRTKVRMKDSFGWAAQAGVDIDLSERIFLNLDVKYIDIDTRARLATAAAGTQRVKLNLDPIVFGVGLGTRF